MDRKVFYDRLRGNVLGNPLKQSLVDGMEVILNEWLLNYPAEDRRYLAYILGTAYHETAGTMQPIEEYGKGKGRPYGRKLKMNHKPYDLPDKIYYGRGFVQLTWYDNYEKAGKLLGIDLLESPELALEPGNAAKIIVRGMIEGWFTGLKLSHYFNYEKEDWNAARKIINGVDRALLIAGYAKEFYNCIQSAYQK